MNLKNTINPIILFTTAFLLLVTVIVYFVYTNQENPNTCATPEPQPFCATESTPVHAVEGKNLFNANCAACHKLDARSTGPGLRATDSVVYWKWLSPKKTTLDSTQLEQMGIDYHRNFSFKWFSKKDLENIYEYIR